MGYVLKAAPAIQSRRMGWLRDGISVVSRVMARRSATQPLKKSESKVVILRRGLSPEYYFYFEIFAKQNNIDFVVDRRVAERRRERGQVSEERRSTDRRGPLPPTWDEADIVIRQSDAAVPKKLIKPQLTAVTPLQR